MANRVAIRSEIWDSWVRIEHTWGTFDLIVFKVIGGQSVRLHFFRKYDFQSAASSTLVVLFQPSFLWVCLCQSTKKLFLEI